MSEPRSMTEEEAILLAVLSGDMPLAVFADHLEGSGDALGAMAVRKLELVPGTTLEAYKGSTPLVLPYAFKDAAFKAIVAVQQRDPISIPAWFVLVAVQLLKRNEAMQREYTDRFWELPPDAYRGNTADSAFSRDVSLRQMFHQQYGAPILGDPRAFIRMDSMDSRDEHTESLMARWQADIERRFLEGGKGPQAPDDPITPITKTLSMLPEPEALKLLALEKLCRQNLDPDLPPEGANP